MGAVGVGYLHQWERGLDLHGIRKRLHGFGNLCSSNEGDLSFKDSAEKKDWNCNNLRLWRTVRDFIQGSARI